MEPRFNDLRYNDIPGLTINVNIPLPSKSYSKMYGEKPQYNDLRYNDIPGLTMGTSLTEHKLFPAITIKSISEYRKCYYSQYGITKQSFITFQNNNDKLFDMFYGH